MRSGTVVFLLITGWVALMACENTDCISFSRDYVIIQFLDTAESTKNINVEYVTAAGSPFLFYTDTTFNRVALPIDTEVAQTTFIFAQTDDVIDTLEIGYLQRQQLISETCGFELQYRQLQVLGTSFPGAIVEFDELNLLNDIDVTVYH